MIKLSEVTDWKELINQVTWGDCLEGMKLIPDKSIDLILTDPPYGIGEIWKGGWGSGWGKARRESIKRNEWDGDVPPPEYFDQIFRISKSQIIWGGNYFNLPPSRCWLVWNKPEREFSLAEAELAWTSFDKVIRVFDCHRSDSNRQHPTQKPVELMRWILEKYTEPTDVIGDPFMGSWTTARACKDLGRDFIGFELEEEYCKVGEERLRQQNLF